MLDQCLSTVPQHQWISKLFNIDISVEYRPGHLNVVADTLSHARPGASTRRPIRPYVPPLRGSSR
jgi:hypothetical protein